MIGARFDYVAPSDVASCVAALEDGSRVLAGGTWVVPEMARGESRPRRVVDLKKAGISAIRGDAGRLEVGAMATYSAILSSDLVARHAPVLRAMAETITGGWAIGNQGTVGGSAAAARPQSDVPAALAVCGAQVRIAAVEGEHRMSIEDFFVDAMATALRPDQLVVGFDLPSWDRWGHGYLKIKRGGSSWPIVTAAALVKAREDGMCMGARLAIGGLDAVPVVVDLTAIAEETPFNDQIVTAATDLAVEAVRRPWSDVLAPAEYRRAVAPAAIRRALTAAWRDAATRNEGGSL